MTNHQLTILIANMFFALSFTAEEKLQPILAGFVWVGISFAFALSPSLQ